MPNRLFEKAPVQIPNKSGFNEGHYNHFSGKTGTLIPVLTDLLIPNDKINLSLSCQVQLPPMSSDFFGHIDMKFEAFFVPLRLCYGGFQEMITHYNGNTINPILPEAKVERFPYIWLRPATGDNASPEGVNEYGPGTLADYLGLKTHVSSVGNVAHISNPTPFIAYHLIWQEWYRNPFIQLPAFGRPAPGTPESSYTASHLPYISLPGSNPFIRDINLRSGYLSKLRQRNWAKDYFTNAKPKPEAGDPSTLSFQVDGNTGSFTIASLRAANALQQWLERNNVAGYRYADQIRAHFGIRPSDAVVDRPIFIGQQVVPVYTKGITQTAQGTESNRQPFNSVGSKFGQSVGVGNGYLGEFHATEYGYIMVIASLVPRSLYSSGTRRYLSYSNTSDFATPILQSIGDQPIKKIEISDTTPGSDIAVQTFGYTQRFSEYKDMYDEVHGILQDGESLSMFSLQRSFEGNVELSSSFIEIPTDYLDQVTAVDSATSDFGYWCDVYFDYNKTSVLSEYSIPTLGELKYTHTEFIPNGGEML